MKEAKEAKDAKSCTGMYITKLYNSYKSQLRWDCPLRLYIPLEELIYIS